MLKMAYRVFEGLLRGVFDSEVAYLTYCQLHALIFLTVESCFSWIHPYINMSNVAI
jgi:hypothetical protein